MKKYIQPGEVIDYTPTAATTAGTVVLIGKRVGIVLADIAANDTGGAQVTGVHEIAKLGTDVVTQGALLYWDDTNKYLTLTVGSNTLAGYAFKAAGNGATTVQIKLNA